MSAIVAAPLASSLAAVIKSTCCGAMRSIGTLPGASIWIRPDSILVAMLLPYDL
jgi:hypothetical protein